jgi:hypothetical protein
MSVPPSKLIVVVAPTPRAVGNAGSVTSALPPMVMVAVPESAAPKLVKHEAAKVPPVRLRVPLLPS